jgi:hypothetical protein
MSINNNYHFKDYPNNIPKELNETAIEAVAGFVEI